MAEKVRRLVVPLLAILVVAMVGCKPASPPKVAYSDAALRKAVAQTPDNNKNLDGKAIRKAEARMESLVDAGGERAMNVLIDIVKNEPNLVVAGEAVMLLGKCSDPRSVEAILSRIDQVKSQHTFDTGLFLIPCSITLSDKTGRDELGPHKENVRKLAHNSLEDGPITPIHAAEILGRIGTQDDVPILVQMMRPNKADKRHKKKAQSIGGSWAAKALLEIGTPEAIEAVRERLKHIYSDQMEKGGWRKVEDQLKQIDSKK